MTFETKSGAKEMSIAANPHLKKIDVYNSHGKLVSNKIFKPQRAQHKKVTTQAIGTEDNSQKKATANGSLLPKLKVKQESGERIGRR